MTSDVWVKFPSQFCEDCERSRKSHSRSNTHFPAITFWTLFPNRDASETRTPLMVGKLARSMTVERHLILQELTLRPSGEWTPHYRGWVVARVAEGAGYWWHGGNARELNVGDGFVVGCNSNVRLRSSQLGPLKLQFFTVQPEYLNGILTVTEWHQLKVLPDHQPLYVSVFSAAEPVGQKFTRLAEHPVSDGLSLRCALLQLWSGSLQGLLNAPIA